MAWTTPTSRSTGDLITASIYNTDIIDNLNYLKSLADGKVALTGNETVAGIKTFSSFPVTPSSAPSSNYQAANKKYVDDYFGAVERGFSAKMSGNQSLSSSTDTKIAFNSEEFDTHGEYNASTYRYTPQRAGKYLIIGKNTIGSLTDGQAHYVKIFKNGSQYSSFVSITGGAYNPEALIVDILEFNGSTDYIELYARQISGSTKTIYSDGSWFQAWYLGE